MLRERRHRCHHQKRLMFFHQINDCMLPELGKLRLVYALRRLRPQLLGEVCMTGSWSVWGHFLPALLGGGAVHDDGQGVRRFRLRGEAAEAAAGAADGAADGGLRVTFIERCAPCLAATGLVTCNS